MADGHPGQISIKRTLPPDAPQFVIPTKPIRRRRKCQGRRCRCPTGHDPTAKNLAKPGQGRVGDQEDRLASFLIDAVMKK